MRNPLVVVWVLVLVLVLVIIGAFAYIRFGANVQQQGVGIELPFLTGSEGANGIKYTETNTPYKVLIAKNREFVIADALVAEDKPLDAIPHYQNALAAATDAIQEAQIKFKLASAYIQAQDIAKGVVLYKEIADNTSYYALVRAYSVEAIADVLRSSSSDIRALVYGDAPYKNFVVSGDDRLTERKLFEYAVSIYPLGLSEIYIAGWYVRQLEESFFAPRPLLSEEERTRYIEAAQNALIAVEKDIARIKNDTNLVGYVARLYMFKGSVNRGLARVGVLSVGAPEQDFKRAMEIYATVPNKSYDGITRFQYARYLNQLYGEKRKSDVIELLAPLYSSNVYDNSYVSRYIAGERANVYGRKSDLVALAFVDPKFKTYMKSLGWSESDFKSTK